MRIAQVTPAYLYGDAVGNDITTIHHALVERGFNAAIYAQAIDPRKDDTCVHAISDPCTALNEYGKNDVVFYHMATRDDFIYHFAEGPYRKVMVYHNITPPHFFGGYNLVAAHQCRLALDQVRYLSGKLNRCIADSEWNKHDLEGMGYDCPIDVVPIVIPFNDYQAPPDTDTLRDVSRTKGTKLIFNGRIAPHKCIEDIIAAYACYQRIYDANATLYLVGSYSNEDAYYRKLRAYAKAIGTEGVVFTGHVSFPALLAYYAAADVFVCQSEHEGFCVPAVEAMIFGLPIIAYATTALPDTIGGGGILLQEKDPRITAGAIHRVMSNQGLRSTIAKNQKVQLERYRYETVTRQFFKSLDTLASTSAGA